MAIKSTAEQFLKAPHKKLSPLYVVHGAEPLGIIEACDGIRKAARAAGYDEQEIYTFERALILVNWPWQSMRYRYLQANAF